MSEEPGSDKSEIKRYIVGNMDWVHAYQFGIGPRAGREFRRTKSLRRAMQFISYEKAKEYCVWPDGVYPLRIVTTTTVTIEVER